jgi:hypothetical protein
MSCDCRDCRPVVLPASFDAPSAPMRLGVVPAAATTPTQTPLGRPDPTDAWYDLSTVANVVSIVSNLLRAST